jgi:rhamnosyltransferase
VAVLLATYNGARYLEPQMRSLAENKTKFTLHWLDDHSIDNTREVVRATARDAAIDLREWHQQGHQGVPGAYFKLLECVEAEVYLFCDQDDIWQPGKIDAFVNALQQDIAAPVLCFSEPLVFGDEKTEKYPPLSEVLGMNAAQCHELPRLFMHNPAFGHSMGFTRRLRDIFLTHLQIAQAYALMHDWWIYVVAQASGSARLLTNVPTTLYRRHGKNWGQFGYVAQSARRFRIARMWRLQQKLRPMIARQAKGFLLAAHTFPSGPKLERLRSLAQIVATLDRRASPAALLRLAHRGAMYPDIDFVIPFAVACLCCNAE